MRSILPLLRIASRDALRARGRSALIVAMILLPVFGLTFADVLARTAQPDPEEALERRLGQTQALLEPVPGSTVQQLPDPLDGWEVHGAGPAGPVDALAAVPPGARVLTSTYASVNVRTAGGTGRVGWEEVTAADPAFRGRFELLDGRAPEGRDEVLVTEPLLARTGLDVGDTLTVVEPADLALTVVGTAVQLGHRGDESVLALPGTLVGRAGGIPADTVTTQVFLAGADPVTWEEVLALNERGLVVTSRAVLQDPPPRAAVPYDAPEWGSGGDVVVVVLLGALVVGLGGLEVVLLAGAAFAVGARRQARTLGLLAATGASARQVSLVVLCSGAVLGAVAAVLGVLGGVGAAALARPLIENLTTDASFARFDVRPLELLAIGALGVVTGILSAVLPARAAARADVVATLAGRRGQVRTRARVPALGVVLLAAGVASAATGSLWGTALDESAAVSERQGYLVAALIAGGAGSAVVGLVVLSPAVVGLAGRLAARLPLAPRIALRDAARHRSRSAPAVSAVLAAVSTSAALLLYVAAQDDADGRSYVPSYLAGTAGVDLGSRMWDQVTGDEDGPPPVDLAAVERVVRAELPVAGVERVDSVTAPCWDPEGCGYVDVVMPEANACPVWSLTREPTAEELAAARSDPRCSEREAGYLTGPLAAGHQLVGDVEGLRALVGEVTPEARQALERGGAVVFDPYLLSGGEVSYEVFSAETLAQQPPPGQEETWSGPRPDRVVTVEAVAMDTGGAVMSTYLSPQAASRLGAGSPEPAYLLLDLDRTPSQAEEDAANAALRPLTVEVRVERGYQSEYGLGLLALVAGAGVVTLGAAGVATGLAQADARADHATLAAVGGAPRLRRDLAGWQALTIAALGTALGVTVGFVPALALIGALERLELVLPWAQLGLVLVGIPLLAGASAWASVRSRLPLERRAAA